MFVNVLNNVGLVLFGVRLIVKGQVRINDAVEMLVTSVFYMQGPAS